MVSQSFCRLHNHGEDCWLDSCPKDDHWHLAQGGQDAKGHCKEAGCSQSSVSKHINREAKGRKRVVEKSVQAIGITAPWRGLWNKIHSKMWGRFTKSGLQLESVLQEPLRTDICKTWVSGSMSSHSWTTDSVRSVSPGLKTKRTGLLLSGPKLCSLMKVNFAFPLEIRVPESGGREEGTESTLLEVQCKFPQSVMVWGAM